jgi:Na+/phosphate symporter
VTKKVTTEGKEHEDRLVHGYEQMLERARSILEQAKTKTIPHLQQLIDEAQDKAVELGELSREEAERLGDYLRRDLEDAAQYLSYTGRSLADWLNFDLDLVEARLMELFAAMVDHTRLELDRLAEQARQTQELHTGEIASPGTLRCVRCEAELHFNRMGHIPPCGKCHGTVFQRLTR